MDPSARVSGRRTVPNRAVPRLHCRARTAAYLFCAPCLRLLLPRHPEDGLQDDSVERKEGEEADDDHAGPGWWEILVVAVLLSLALGYFVWREMESPEEPTAVEQP